MAAQARSFMILRKVEPEASSHMQVKNKTQDNLPDAEQCLCYAIISESHRESLH